MIRTASDENRWISYDFAILRVVPHVHIGAFVPIGVIVHARTEEFIAARVLTDVNEIERLLPEIDAELLSDYLRSWRAICDGDVTAGPISLAPPSERFHWLTAPRSDVLQSGPVHEGLCDSPAAALSELFESIVSARAHGR
ncbi:MAG: DUF3037 domain-containing protein [Gemmatimonadaceae bacterium]